MKRSAHLSGGVVLVVALSLASHVRAQKLPLVELPVAAGAPELPGRPLGFVFSGDGDWAGADKDVAEAFARAGIPVVGLKARSYLRGAHRTPEGTARDISTILTEYLERWQRETLILVGYSRGADLMPFIVNRLPPELRERIRMVALLGPQPNASFTFHFMDLVRDKHRSTDLPVLPEIERMKGLRIVCVYGEKESGSLCPAAPPGLMETLQRPGRHGLGGEGTDVADMLLKRLRS